MGCCCRGQAGDGGWDPRAGGGEEQGTPWSTAPSPLRFSKGVPSSPVVHQGYCLPLTPKGRCRSFCELHEPLSSSRPSLDSPCQLPFTLCYRRES